MLSRYVCHNFLHRCLIDLNLVAMERRLEYLLLCCSTRIQKKKLIVEKTLKIKGFASQNLRDFQFFSIGRD